MRAMSTTDPKKTTAPEVGGVAGDFAVGEGEAAVPVGVVVGAGPVPVDEGGGDALVGIGHDRVQLLPVAFWQMEIPLLSHHWQPFPTLVQLEQELATAQPWQFVFGVPCAKEHAVEATHAPTGN